jgi:hypothetical protein
MSEGLSCKLQDRKDGLRTESSDYVDGWNDALASLEQGTTETAPESSVFEDMLEALPSHLPVEPLRGKVPQGLIDVLARDEDTKAFVLRTVSEIKHDARTSSMIGCLFAACAGATSILLGAPGIVVAFATYGSGVGAGWLAALLISAKRGRPSRRRQSEGGLLGGDHDQGA